MRTILVMSLLAAALLSTGCGGENECTDNDGDGFFAASSSCPGGRDCDDSEASVNPGEDEICDNGRDDNCDDQVDECGGPDASGDADPDASSPDGSDDADAGPDLRCVDEDDDGYGKLDANGACSTDEPDCDDSNPEVYPGAEETCNDRDDDCDGETDECALESATCREVDGTERCIRQVGDECEDSTQCPIHTVCDAGIQPPECRRIRGEQCSLDEECRANLQCAVGRCAGSYCANESCSGDSPYCDDSSQACVACRYWYDDTASLGDCPNSESCIGDGICARTIRIDDAKNVSPYMSVTRDTLIAARELAKCWGDLNGGDKSLCLGFVTTDALNQPIREQEIRDAHSEFKDAKNNGNLNGISEDNVENLGNLLGDGALDLNNLKWETDIPPESDGEVCAWFDPHGSFSREKLHVDRCSSYEP